uniref:E3 ubiquitin protein ligase n=1 Tax=Geospiza parvula TaxID=87175 RepID=A0A8C3MTH6_GEOPR
MPLNQLRWLPLYSARYYQLPALSLFSVLSYFCCCLGLWPVLNSGQFMEKSFSKLQERVETAESRVSVLETMIDDLQWDIDKIRKREQRLNRHLADVLERVNSKGYKVYGPRSSLYGGTITIQGKFEEMNAEGEESKELAGNRLNELEELCQDLEEVTRQNEKLKCCSVMWQNDNSLILFLSLSLSLFSISMKVLKKVGRSVVCCRGVSVFAGPINREMRHLISSLQNHNHQLKGEVLRYKRKLREAQADLSKISSRSGSALLQSQSSTEDTKEEPAEIKQEPDDPSAQVTVPRAASEAVNEMKARQDEEEREEREGKGTRVGKAEAEGVREGERESKEKEKGKHEDGRKKEAEVIKQLKTELKKEKAQESQKEMKLLLDIYCSAPKEQRDKVQLMAAEKAKAELDYMAILRKRYKLGQDRLCNEKIQEARTGQAVMIVGKAEPDNCVLIAHVSHGTGSFYTLLCLTPICSSLVSIPLHIAS